MIIIATIQVDQLTPRLPKPTRVSIQLPTVQVHFDRNVVHANLILLVSVFLLSFIVFEHVGDIVRRGFVLAVPFDDADGQQEDEDDDGQHHAQNDAQGDGFVFFLVIGVDKEARVGLHIADLNLIDEKKMN